MKTLVAVLALLSAGCQGRSTGSVSGDVFLLMQNGDVKRGAGNTVLLLGPADSVLGTRAHGCTAYGEQLLAAARGGGGPPTEEALAARLDTAFLRFAVASSKTGVNAHYRIDHVPTGRYILWAETVIGDNAYTWWAPVMIAGSDSVLKDLDNSTEAHAAVYCGQVKDSLAPTLAHIQDSVATFAERVRDSVANFAERQRRQGWLRCMTEARAALKIPDGVVEAAMVDRQRECWHKFPVDPLWANRQNP